MGCDYKVCNGNKLGQPTHALLSGMARVSACPPLAGVEGIGVKLRNEKTNNIGLIVFAILAPKGRYKIAQGNALGLALWVKQALKGRHKV